MKSAHDHVLSSITASVLLIGLGVQFISGAPLGRAQSIVLAAPRSQGNTRIVASTADSGPGTLRQALLDAQSGDIITFDPLVFPPSAPVTISITSSLPHINQGNLTIDASNAGVILDGSNVPEAWGPGLEIASDGNRIQGLQISNFSGAGIALSGGAQYNMIGGDRNVGTGLFGQGNLTSWNDVGIGLWDSHTSHNTIKGNLIGTDAGGADDWGNHSHGIMILEGASYNTIGPDNVIAHNGGNGISIANADSVRNTITQNSIHDNDGIGIGLDDGGNTELIGPLILDFDLTAGTVAGTTCAKCTVEIFSDSDDEGGVYEGQIVANSSGVFAFNKGASFTDPHLTATATDTDGDTSQFSAPTSGTSRSLILQEGNYLPRTLLRTKQSSELEDNRVAGFTGGGWSPTGEPWDPDGIVNQVVGLGLKRFRFSINNLDADNVNWSKPEFSIHPNHDELITRLAENGVTITYVLTFWDKATYPGGVGAPCPRFKTEGEIQRYLDFVQFIVHHFEGRVQYFEIWNEPDVTLCPQWIEVADYINLVKRAVPVIRQANPDAKIQVGGVSYLRYSEVYDYLFSILESDIMPLVDVFSWHPMYGTSPEYDADRQYYYEYPSIVQEIKDVASAHGFEGDYEADELTWYTIEGTHWDGWSRRYSNIIAAKYHARGTVMHLGMDVTAGNGAVPTGETSRAAILSAIRSLCTIMAGAEVISLSAEIETEATNVMSYTFSLSNSDQLVALWTDGVAVEDDPGVEATLILNGSSDRKVMGIDVLYGFEQQMMTDTKDENLVIHDLLVKDYPIMLRLTSTKNIFLPIVLKSYTH